MKKKFTKIDLHQVITDQIIERLETIDTSADCSLFESAMVLPKNYVTGKSYRGVNLLSLLVFNPFPTSEWATFNQWKSIGGNVKKGEKGFRIVFYKPKFGETDDDGREAKSGYAVMKPSSVFNIAQVEGLNESDKPTLEIPSIGEAEDFIKNTGAVIKTGTSAFYAPGLNQIVMPEISQFVETDPARAQENYLAVVLHELTHWTNNKGDIKRDHDYSTKEGRGKEELVAEIGAAFLCARLGVTQTLREDHVEYVASWLGALNNDKKFIFQAAAEAQKAVDYLVSLQPEAGETATEEAA